MTTISSEQHRLIEALMRKAGAELLKLWPGRHSGDKSQLQIETKGDGSFVTQADYASNKILLDGLREYFPQIAIVSEESPRDGKRHDAVWIVDPLDGTKSFINGVDDFSILIGLSSMQESTYGAAYYPARDIFAYAQKGEGAKINGEVGAVSRSSFLRDSAVYFRNFEPIDGPYLFRDWMDSGMAFLSIATAKMDGAILRMKTHQEWDLCATSVIIKEAGGRVTDEKGEPIRFNQPKIAFEYLVASNGLVHDKLLALIPK